MFLDSSIVVHSKSLGIVLENHHGLAVVTRFLAQPSGEVSDGATSGLAIGSIISGASASPSSQTKSPAAPSRQRTASADFAGKSGALDFGATTSSIATAPRPCSLSVRRPPGVLSADATSLPLVIWSARATARICGEGQSFPLASSEAEVDPGAPLQRPAPAVWRVELIADPHLGSRLVLRSAALDQLSCVLEVLREEVEEPDRDRGGMSSLAITGVLTAASNSMLAAALPDLAALQQGGQVPLEFHRHGTLAAMAVYPGEQPTHGLRPASKLRLQCGSKAAQRTLLEALSVRLHPNEIALQAAGVVGLRVLLQGKLEMWEPRLLRSGTWTQYDVKLRADGGIQWFLPRDEPANSHSLSSPHAGEAYAWRPRGGAAVAKAHVCTDMEAILAATKIKPGAAEPGTLFMLTLRDAAPRASGAAAGSSGSTYAEADTSSTYVFRAVDATTASVWAATITRLVRCHSADSRNSLLFNWAEAGEAASEPGHERLAQDILAGRSLVFNSLEDLWRVRTFGSQHVTAPMLASVAAVTRAAASQLTSVKLLLPPRRSAPADAGAAPTPMARAARADGSPLADLVEIDTPASTPATDMLVQRHTHRLGVVATLAAALSDEVWDALLTVRHEPGLILGDPKAAFSLLVRGSVQLERFALVDSSGTATPPASPFVATAQVIAERVRDFMCYEWSKSTLPAVAPKSGAGGAARRWYPFSSARKEDDAAGFVRRHQWTTLAAHFMPILADSITAARVFDALVQGTRPLQLRARATAPGMQHTWIERLEQVLSYSLFSKYIASMVHPIAGPASGWASLHERLELDPHEMLVRKEDYVELALTVEVLAPMIDYNPPGQPADVLAAALQLRSGEHIPPPPAVLRRVLRVLPHDPEEAWELLQTWQSSFQAGRWDAMGGRPKQKDSRRTSMAHVRGWRTSESPQALPGPGEIAAAAPDTQAPESLLDMWANKFSTWREAPSPHAGSPVRGTAGITTALSVAPDSDDPGSAPSPRAAEAGPDGAGDSEGEASLAMEALSELGASQSSDADDDFEREVQALEGGGLPASTTKKLKRVLGWFRQTAGDDSPARTAGLGTASLAVHAQADATLAAQGQRGAEPSDLSDMSPAPDHAQRAARRQRAQKSVPANNPNWIVEQDDFWHLHKTGSLTVRVSGTLFLSDQSLYLLTDKNECLVAPIASLGRMQYCDTQAASRFGLRFSSVADNGLHVSSWDMRRIAFDDDADQLNAPSPSKVFFAAAAAVADPTPAQQWAMSMQNWYQEVDMFLLEYERLHSGVAPGSAPEPPSNAAKLRMRSVSSSGASLGISAGISRRYGSSRAVASQQHQHQHQHQTRVDSSAGSAVVHSSSTSASSPPTARSPPYPNKRSAWVWWEQFPVGPGYCAVFGGAHHRDRGRCRSSGVLIFSRLKDVIMAKGEERVGGRRRIVSEALQELSAAARLERAAAQAMGTQVFRLEPGMLLAMRAPDKQPTYASLARAWLECTRSDEQLVARRLRLWAALNVHRTRAVFKATERCVSSLLLCTAAEEAAIAKESASLPELSAAIEEVRRQAGLPVPDVRQGALPDSGASSASPLASAKPAGTPGCAPESEGHGASQMSAPVLLTVTPAVQAWLAGGRTVDELTDAGSAGDSPGLSQAAQRELIAADPLTAVSAVLHDRVPLWVLLPVRYMCNSDSLVAARFRQLREFSRARATLEWRVFHETVLTPYRVLRAAIKFTLEWHAPELTALVLVLLLLIPWWNVISYVPALVLLTNAGAVFALGAMDEGARARLERLLGTRRQASSKALLDRIRAFQRILGQSQLRIHRLNDAALRLRALYTWADPKRSALFCAALLSAGILWAAIPVRALWVMWVLFWFLKAPVEALRGTRGRPGLVKLARRRFWYGLPSYRLANAVYAESAAAAVAAQPTGTVVEALK